MEEGVSQHVPYQVDGEVLVPWRVFFLALLLFRGLEGDGLYGGWHCGCFDAGGLSMLKHAVPYGRYRREQVGPKLQARDELQYSGTLEYYNGGCGNLPGDVRMQRILKAWRETSSSFWALIWLRC